MGTICAHPNQKDECTQTVDTNKKNSVMLQGQLGHTSHIQLLLGHYRQQRADSLFVIVQNKYISHCDPLKQYALDSAKALATIQNMRKTYLKVTTHKTCPFRKLQICILPHYRSEQREQYIQLFGNIVRQAMEQTKQMLVEFSHTIEGVSTLPNQILIHLLLKQVADKKGGFKLCLGTSEKKMMSFYRYELMKTEQFHVTTA